MCPLPIFSGVSVGASVKRTQPARARWKTKYSPSASRLTNLPKRRTPVTVRPSSAEIGRIRRLEHREGDDLDLRDNGAAQVLVQEVRQGRHFRKLGHVPSRYRAVVRVIAPIMPESSPGPTGYAYTFSGGQFTLAAVDIGD